MVLVHQPTVGFLHIFFRGRWFEPQGFVSIVNHIPVLLAGKSAAKAALCTQYCFQVRQLHSPDPKQIGNPPEQLALAGRYASFTQGECHLYFQKGPNQLRLITAGLPQLHDLLIDIDIRSFSGREELNGTRHVFRAQSHLVHYGASGLNFLLRDPSISLGQVPHDQKSSFEKDFLTNTARINPGAPLFSTSAKASQTTIELMAEQYTDCDADQMVCRKVAENAAANFSDPVHQQVRNIGAVEKILFIIGSARARIGAFCRAPSTVPMSEIQMPNALYESRLTALTRVSQGKVRDIYSIDEHHLLIVTSDRISAFDVILPDPIPGKGEVLSDLSNFWFAKTTDIIDNHLADLSLDAVIPNLEERQTVASRATVVRRLNPLPIEAVVRGYLIGSGWKDYQASGKVCGIQLPDGLPLAAQLPEPIFTPATKAEIGEHDENISFAQVEDLIGRELAGRVQQLALEIYSLGAKYAAERGIIVADTKFEFGLDDGGKLYLIDEVLTPDSSRFWPASEYRIGISPPSFDKQFVRDYLESLDWNKKAPGPNLPTDIIEKTGEKYRLARTLLTAPSAPDRTEM